MEALFIHEMSEKHLDDVLRIEEADNTNPQSAQTFIKEIHDPTFINLIISNDSVLIGFCTSQIIGDELHIYSLSVDLQYRRQGFATKLLKQLIKNAKSLSADKATLEVRVNNVAAIELYKNLGFKQEAIREKYYQDNGEDASIMWLHNLEGVL